jgi:hypothetical protein
LPSSSAPAAATTSKLAPPQVLRLATPAPRTAAAASDTLRPAVLPAFSTPSARLPHTGAGPSPSSAVGSLAPRTPAASSAAAAASRAPARDSRPSDPRSAPRLIPPTATHTPPIRGAPPIEICTIHEGGSYKRVHAVARGFKIGLFGSWADTEPLVKGYKGAQHKGFATWQEAVFWLFKYGVHRSEWPVPPDPEAAADTPPESEADGAGAAANAASRRPRPRHGHAAGAATAAAADAGSSRSASMSSGRGGGDPDTNLAPSPQRRRRAAFEPPSANADVPRSSPAWLRVLEATTVLSPSVPAATLESDPAPPYNQLRGVGRFPEELYSSQPGVPDPPSLTATRLADRQRAMRAPAPGAAEQTEAAADPQSQPGPLPLPSAEVERPGL